MSVIVDGGGGSVDTSALVQKIGDTMTGDLTFSNAGIVFADTIGMNTSYSETSAESVATRFWNSVKGTTTLVTGNGSALDDGQELRFYGKASESINNGDFVQFAGSQGDHVLFKRVVPAEVIANRYLFMGVATTDIANGDFGNVTVFGYVNDINTTGWNQNDLIYVDNSTGQGTNVAPTAGELKILVAVVIKEETSPAAANGEILVRPTWYSRLTELEDINGTPLTTSGQFLVWDNVNGYFDATSNIANFDAAGSAAAAVQRANHTGTQLLATISDVTATGSSLAKAASVDAARVVLGLAVAALPPRRIMHHTLTWSATDTAGSPSTGQLAGGMFDLRSGATANGQSRYRVNDDRIAIGRTYAGGFASWSRRIEIQTHVTSIIGNAQGVFRGIFGKGAAAGFGLVASGNYVGWTVENDTLTTGIVCKAGTVTSVALTPTAGSSPIGLSISIISDNGTVNWYANGVLVGTTTAGPVADNSQGTYNYEINNGATAANYIIQFWSQSEGY